MRQKISSRICRQVAWPVMVTVGLAGGAVYASNPAQDAVNTQAQAVKQNQESQKKIDAIADQSKQLVDEYKAALSETESLKAYNDQMEKLIASQKSEMDSIAKQILSIEVTNKEVVPLMQKMISSLEQFVALDVPFLQKERVERVENLKNMMGRADVTTSEKYRRVMEAYQVENEYGRSIEAYTDDVDQEGKRVTVDFLRFGRVALIYQTRDGKDAFAWDQKGKKWVELPDTYRTAIRDGLKMARKQTAPDLITLPIAGAEAAQ